MLNEEKIRIMTGIAMFEKKAGRDILPASRYFKSDYVGGRMIRSFIFYTFSSMLCLALWVLYQMEDIMSTMDVTGAPGVGKACGLILCRRPSGLSGCHLLDLFPTVRACQQRHEDLSGQAAPSGEKI